MLPGLPSSHTPSYLFCAYALLFAGFYPEHFHLQPQRLKQIKLPPPPIVFLVTNGVYQYNIGPSNDEFQPSSGTVTVNGADVIITVTGPVTSCTAVASG